MRLDFSYFYTEGGYDWVSVWEGSSTSGNYIGRWSGSSIPPSTLVNTSDMYVRFSSDGSNTFPGFVAHYNSDPGMDMYNYFCIKLYRSNVNYCKVVYNIVRRSCLTAQPNLVV